MKKSLKGFTLIEVMVTLAIIGILVSIAWPLYQRQSLKSQRGEAVALANMLRLEMERCASNNGGSYAAICPNAATAFVQPAIRTKYDPSGTRGDIYGINIAITGGGTGYTITISNLIGNDDECATFTLDSLGNKGFTVQNGATSSVARCWGSN